MDVVVVGAGPVGIVGSIALARAGHPVTLVDRDPGPAGPVWERRGVMQFMAPHFFRPQVRDVLDAVVPEAWPALLAAGAVPGTPPGAPDGVSTLSARRSTVERVLWTLARREPGVRPLTGHADRVLVEGGRAAGVMVDGHRLAADVVVCAAGRASRLAEDARPPGECAPCGLAYVSRMYRARPGTPPPESFGPLVAVHQGYFALVFPHDGGFHSVLVVRAAHDQDLAQLRDPRCFDAVAPAVPRLAPWVDPDAYEPVAAPVAGAGLTNGYRRQTDERGAVAVPGLVFVGDAVSTTNPQAGRGVALGLGQLPAMLAHLATVRPDPVEAARALDAHGEAQVRPWVEDHVRTDAAVLRRFAGHDVDVDGPLPSDVVCAAGAVDPVTAEVVGLYQAMVALPEDLRRSAQERARALLRTGWRPPVAPGPSRDELAELVQRATVGAA